jgi:hypothetical protein
MENNLEIILIKSPLIPVIGILCLIYLIYRRTRFFIKKYGTLSSYSERKYRHDLKIFIVDLSYMLFLIALLIIVIINNK